jgi:hypothetical protein
MEAAEIEASKGAASPDLAICAVPSWFLQVNNGFGDDKTRKRLSVFGTSKWKFIVSYGIISNQI